MQVNRLRLSSFNDFDGDKVADSLIANKHLWDGFVWGRFIYNELIELRDIHHGIINADTLMILSTIDRWKDLKSVINKWSADEIGHISGDGKTVGTHSYTLNYSFDHNRSVNMALGSALGQSQILVRVWWD